MDPFTALLINLAFQAISLAFGGSQKPKGPAAPTVEEITGPDGREGAPIPVIFGTPFGVPLSGVAQMDFEADPIIEKSGKK